MQYTLNSLVQCYRTNKPRRLYGQHGTIKLIENGFSCVSDEKPGNPDPRHRAHHNEISIGFNF